MAVSLSRETWGGVILGLGLSALALAYGAMNGQTPAATDTRAVSASLLLEQDAPQLREASDWNEHSEMIQQRRLPIVKDGKRVFDLYRRPADLPPLLLGEAAKPKLSLIVTGLGYDRKASEAALDALPIDAALALSPYAPYSEVLAAKADATRRELWLGMPSATQDRNAHIGSEALELHAPANTNIAHLHDALALMRNYVGIVLSPDSTVASSIDDMEPILQEVKNRGLGLARLTMAPNLSVGQAAIRHGVPFVDGGMAFADPPLPEVMSQKLDAALTTAQTAGSALLILDAPNMVAVKTFKDWLSAHEGEFDFVPPSSLAAGK